MRIVVSENKHSDNVKTVPTASPLMVGDQGNY